MSANLKEVSKINNFYLATDCETGGVIGDFSLLEVYFQLLDYNLKPQGELLLKVCPNDRIYKVAAGALAINKINLIEHDKIAQTYGAAGQLLYNFLSENTKDGAVKLCPIGHNVHYDLDCIYKNLVGKLAASKFVSYRNLDTGGLAVFLESIGALPHTGKSWSLKNLALHYKIDINDHQYAPHTAKGDTLLTVEILRQMTTQMQSLTADQTFSPMPGTIVLCPAAS